MSETISEQTDTQDLPEVLDSTIEETEGDKVTLGEIMDSLGARSFGPLILFLALIAISPIGMIPGMSIITGSLLILICGQILLFRNHPWLPEKLTSKEFSREKLEETVEKARPWALKLDRFMTERLVFLSQTPMLQIIALVCIALAISFYPLALVPFGVLAPAVAILIFGLGLTVSDGIVLLAGFAVTGLAVWLTFKLWPL